MRSEHPRAFDVLIQIEREIEVYERHRADQIITIARLNASNGALPEFSETKRQAAEALKTYDQRLAALQAERTYWVERENEELLTPQGARRVRK